MMGLNSVIRENIGPELDCNAQNNHIFQTSTLYYKCWALILDLDVTQKKLRNVIQAAQCLLNCQNPNSTKTQLN
jgi:hypothetical protein